jgi:hypothetical protein
MDDALDALRGALTQIFREQHATLREVVDGLDATALNWRPGEDTNSIAVLCAHILGSEDFLSATAVGDTIPRDREAEFAVEATDAPALARQVDAVEARVLERIARLTADDLAVQRAPANDPRGRRAPGSWWILHAVEHCREHIGQALLTRQLYEQGQR